jgi:hypothetical protein
MRTCAIAVAPIASPTADARADDPVRDGAATERCRHEKGKRHRDRGDPRRHDERPAEDRDPEPLYREDEGEPFTYLSQDRPPRLAGEGACPRERDSSGGKKEAECVERKRSWRTGGGDEKTPDDRAADPRTLPREALDRVPRDQDVFRHELGNDRAERRDAERARRPEQCVRDVEVPDLESTHESQERDDADDHAAAELRDDDQDAARNAIGDRAPDQEEDEARPREGGDERAELEGRTAKLQDLERVGNVRDERPEEGQRLSGPEQAEVAMAERLDDPRKTH